MVVSSSTRLETAECCCTSTTLNHWIYLLMNKHTSPSGGGSFSMAVVITTTLTAQGGEGLNLDEIGLALNHQVLYQVGRPGRFQLFSFSIRLFHDVHSSDDDAKAMARPLS